MSLIHTLTPSPRTRRVLLVVGICAALLAVPALAFAIPGAGDMTALDSGSGRSIAGLYNMLAKICLVIFVIVCTVLFGSIVLFRRRSDDERPAQIHGNMKIEMGLLIAATVTQIFIGWKTVDVMWQVEKIPATQLTVRAVGYQWGWEFHYQVPDPADETKTKTFISDDLVFPAYKNIKLEITSKDVIHSLFIPELGVKMDAVPGRYNRWWFNADGPLNQVMGTQQTVPVAAQPLKTTRPKAVVGLLNAMNFLDYSEARYAPVTSREAKVAYLAKSRDADDRYAKYTAYEYRGMCTELCGSGHYNMYFRAVAMTQTSYDQWVHDQLSGAGAVVDGPTIYKQCATCHGANGEGVGAFPPLAGSEWVNQDTTENKERHIKVVLSGLQGEIEVKGKKYNAAMQPWFNVFNDEQVAAVINHERTSWGNAGGLVTADMVKEVRAQLKYPPFGAGGAAPIDAAELSAEGAKIYASCASCHGEDGKGAGLATNALVTGDITAGVKLLDAGKTDAAGQPVHSAMGASLTDRQMAALVTYMRATFAQGSSVQPGDISRVRQSAK